MSILLLDVCHTLYKANTTFGFLEQLLKSDQRYQHLSAKRAGFPARLKSLFMPSDDARRLALSFLKGQTEQALIASAHAFVDQLEPIDEIHRYVDQQRNSGAKIVLLSASINVVIDVIAERLGVDAAFSSTLAFKDGLCLGELEQDLAGNKAGIIRQNFSGDELAFLTDNFDDAACSKLVNEFRPVYRASDLRARLFWATQSTGDPLTYES